MPLLRFALRVGRFYFNRLSFADRVAKVTANATPSIHSSAVVTLNPTSSNFNPLPLFPSRSLPLNHSELTVELSRLPTRDLIAQKQGFFVQIGEPGKVGGKREVKTWMEVRITFKIHFSN